MQIRSNQTSYIYNTPKFSKKNFHKTLIVQTRFACRKWYIYNDPQC